MGRHGTGGSESDSPQDPIVTGAFWAAPAQPGRPEPPDQAEVTGHGGLPQQAPPEAYGEPRHPAPPPASGDVKVAGTRTRDVIAGPGDDDVAGAPAQATVPAWAEAPTEFLDTVWHAGEEPPARRGDRRRRPPRGGDGAEPRGKGKVAALAVAAVVVVLGGTVAGVRLLSAAAPAACADDACTVLAQRDTPATAGGPPADPFAAPLAEPVEEEKTPRAAPTPTPAARATQPPPRRAAVPKPTRTRLKRSQEPVIRVVEPPEEKSARHTDPPGSPPPTPGDGFNEIGTSPDTEENETPYAPHRQAPRGSVSVGFDVLRTRSTGYAAKVSIANTTGRALSSTTVSLPLDGRVLDVGGDASWSQDGDLLILDLPGRLPAGRSVAVTVEVRGVAERPETCGVIGAKCVVEG